MENFDVNKNEFYKKVCEELSTEERLFILKNLENKSCLTCLNGCCRVEYAEKIGLNDFGEPEGSRCISWINDELIGKSKILKIKDIHKLK